MKTKKTLQYVVGVSIILLVALFVGLRTPIQQILETTATHTQREDTPSIDSFTIIAFGDSLTAGYGVSLEESYPSILEDELQKRGKNIRVINMGVSGEATTAGVERVDFVIAQKPSLVLLGLGANDMLRATPPSITRTNIETIVKRFKDAQVPVLILGMKSVASNGAEYQEVFDAIYPTFAEEFDMPLVPFFLEGVALNPELNTNDGIHPNKAGYEKIVRENIMPVLLLILEDAGL